MEGSWNHYKVCNLSSLLDLEESDSDQETRLTAAEENIQGTKALFTCTINIIFPRFQNGLNAVLWCYLPITLKKDKMPLTKW